MSARFVGITFAAACAFAASSLTARADDWPSRPLSMVVPFAAGSASDTVGRILAAGMSGPLGQQGGIENIGGAGGMTGSPPLPQAPPPGYQFRLAGGDTNSISQSAYN